jgi:hypothetical protein
MLKVPALGVNESKRYFPSSEKSNPLKLTRNINTQANRFIAIAAKIVAR